MRNYYHFCAYYYCHCIAHTVSTLICKIYVEVTCWNIKFISEHSVFLLVTVQVWHWEPGNMHPCNSNAQITYLPSLYYPQTNLSRSSPTHKKCDKNVAISGMYRLKENVTKMWKLVACTDLKGNVMKILQLVAFTNKKKCDKNVEINGLHNLLLRKHGFITIWLAKYWRRRRRWHAKAPVEIGAGSFVHMKEGVTGTSYKHGFEPPSNWATTHMYIQLMTK